MGMLAHAYKCMYLRSEVSLKYLSSYSIFFIAWECLLWAQNSLILLGFMASESKALPVSAFPVMGPEPIPSHLAVFFTHGYRELNSGPVCPESTYLNWTASLAPPKQHKQQQQTSGHSMISCSQKGWITRFMNTGLTRIYDFLSLKSFTPWTYWSSLTVRILIHLNWSRPYRHLGPSK